MSERKTFTSATSDPFGANVEIEKHRTLAKGIWPYPEHVGTSSTSEPDKKSASGHTYKITTTWQEGVKPADPAPQA